MSRAAVLWSLFALQAICCAYFLMDIAWDLLWPSSINRLANSDVLEALVTIALFVAAAAHAIFILGVSFDPLLKELRTPPPLEVVLVQKSDSERPEEADYLAESAQDGGGAMRLFNIINFNTWARRLQLDFSDLEQGGISYDQLSGELKIENGVVQMAQPVVLESPLSRFVLKGSTDLNASTIDATLDVRLPVSNNVAWITALAVGLPAAAGVFLAGQVFEEQFDRLSTLSYTISGNSDDPDIEFDGFFGTGAND